MKTKKKTSAVKKRTFRKPEFRIAVPVYKTLPPWMPSFHMALGTATARATKQVTNFSLAMDGSVIYAMQGSDKPLYTIDMKELLREFMNALVQQP